MYNYQKIANIIMERFPGGKNISYSEIIKVVLEFTKMKKASIIPSDLCDNHINKDPKSGKHTVFSKDKINEGKYTVLPHEKIRNSCNLNYK